LYTRRGDQGETSLFGPKRVQKDSPRVEAYGTIDELNSVIGVAISSSKDRSVVAPLKELQKLLFVAGADAASESGSKVPRISAEDTSNLEKMTDELVAKLPALKNFILPGGTPTGATLQLSRSVCRRAERRILSASKNEELNPELIPFFNRLSTYLFNLARYANAKAKKREEDWKGR
jgi:cob(I)alamin adenosyltransferase